MTCNVYRVFRAPSNLTQPIDEPNLCRCIMMVNDDKAAVLQRQRLILFYFISFRIVSNVITYCVRVRSDISRQ